MPGPDLSAENSPELTPAQDATERGTTPTGVEDEHRPRTSAELPPEDPNYRQSDVNTRIDRLLREAPPRHRTHTLFPFLFVRAVAGDRGGGPPVWPPISFLGNRRLHPLRHRARGVGFPQNASSALARQSHH